MLILVRKIHHLIDFGFGDFIRENAAYADTIEIITEMKTRPYE